jgi:uracil phosphoribosyltransferase
MKMQEVSYPDLSIPNLFVHPSQKMDALKKKLLREVDNISNSRGYMQRICEHLMEIVFFGNENPQVDLLNSFPLYVMRGGLLMMPACQRLIPQIPQGILFPHRESSLDEPDIIYADIPLPDGPVTYFLLDPLVATGATALACIRNLTQRFMKIEKEDYRISLIAPFLSDVGSDAIFSEFPNVTIHAIWHKEKVDAAHRMVGPGFDVGDCALGGASSKRLQW